MKPEVGGLGRVRSRQYLVAAVAPPPAPGDCARLLDHNQKRYEEEVAAGKTAKGDTKAPVRRARPKTAPAPAAAALPLFDLMAKQGDDE